LRVSDVIENNQDSGVFVNIKEKDFFKVAVQESQARLVDGPGAEYDLLLREKIKRSGDLITLGDFDGLYINIEDGRRVTTGSTGLREKRILVFGGSTILCGELPDSMTVTSNLQKILTSKNLEFDVLNYGISGLRIENQFKILETVKDLNSNDVVVFYDGINDLNRIFEEGLERRANQTPMRQINKIVKELEERSLLFRDISITNYLDGLGVSQAYLANDVGQQISDNWIKFDAIARKYVESKGAKFVHILQPNWLTLESVNNSTKLKKHWSDRKIIQSAFEKSVIPETKIKDLTKIFDDLDTTPFLDWAHIDEVGTAKVAEEMFAVLEPLLTK
jgi:lysophospholipase L1-like esterase